MELEHSYDHTWEQALVAALLGTQRREPPVLADVTQPSRPAEQSLLDAAALLGLYRRAAFRAEAVSEAHQRAPHDDLPEASQRSSRYLAMMLDGQHRQLLSEWLEACVQHKRRVPSLLLPKILEYGKNQPSLQASILPALSARGQWLAAQNPDWAYVRLDPALLDWETGSRADRLALLAHLHRHTPAEAIARLDSTWASERAEDRALFVSALETDLSAHDQAFLESILNDRSKDVRQRVAMLLARIPGSALAQRMLQRAEHLLQWTAPIAGNLLLLRRASPATLRISLPETYDDAMKRDGIEQRPVGNFKGGEHAWWLYQILRAIPPAHWTMLWKDQPSAILQAAAKTDWEDLLLSAWMEASIHFHDASWAEAILQRDPRRAEVMAAIPAERQEAFLLSMLAGQCVPLHRHPVLALLRETKHSWSTQLARAVLLTLRRHIQVSKDTTDYILRSALLEDFVRRIPHSMVQEVAAIQSEQNAERWIGTLEQMLIILQFRHDMLERMKDER